MTIFDNYSNIFQLHGRQFVCQTFLEQITGAKAQKRSPALNKILENVLELFLVQTVLNNLNDILRVSFPLISIYFIVNYAILFASSLS